MALYAVLDKSPKFYMLCRACNKKICMPNGNFYMPRSFNEFSEEQEYFCNWDANFSSDEEILFNGKSEVLWSRNGDIFQYSDSPQEFSDLTGRTLSSCSWHNDEFDMKSTGKVHASLEAIDDALYDKIKSPFISETVFQECSDWAEKFSYLRIKGKCVLTSHQENGPNLDSSNTVDIGDYNFESSYSGLQLAGKRVPLHLSNRSKELYFDSTSHYKVPNCIPEVADETGEEEYFALHKSDEPRDTLHVIPTENAKPISSTKALEEKIINKLVSEIWPNVLAAMEKLDDKSDAIDQLQLPPIIVTAEQKRAFNFQRPRTEGSSFINTEFPKLENILTVSSKVLQKRDVGNSRITRPNSEMSVNLRVSSKSLKPISYKASSISVHSKSESLLPKGNEREPDNSCIILPSLEEHFQDASSVLRGFHIEPCKKLPQKTVVSSRNEIESVSSSRENQYFLPPIVDRNFMPTNLKLTKNLFTFYGPPVIPNQTKTYSSARHNKINSRPSTSVSKRASHNDVTQKLSVKNSGFLTTRNIGNASKSSYSQTNQEEILTENETSQEKSVTLFPIVTPLTPHEDKNHSIKKGLLHSFLGVKKR